MLARADRYLLAQGCVSRWQLPRFGPRVVPRMVTGTQRRVRRYRMSTCAGWLVVQVGGVWNTRVPESGRAGARK